VTHPAQRLDNVVHQRTRLGVLTVLTGAKRVDFTFLRDTLGLTDGNLSRNLTVLENAGYIAVEKQFDGRRPRTWIAITPVGRQVLAREISALREIVEAVEQTPATRQQTPVPRQTRRARPAIS
jgi:DNA-binding MarR family transcriptional regulator